MGKLAIPFNITLLSPTPEQLKGIRPVTALDAFDRNTNNFHDSGLFSVPIFGRVGDERRNHVYSYIDIKIDIMHPVIFNVLGKLKGLYHEIIAGKTYAIWDKTLKDFVKDNAVTGGRTGYAFFLEHWKDIEFEERDSDKRELNIKLLAKFKNKAMFNKVIVEPAGLRDLEVENGRFSEDEINTLYRQLVRLSNIVVPSALKSNPESQDQTRYAMQLAFNAIYDTFLSLIEGKKKLLLSRWAARNVFNGTRNVITSSNTNSKILGHDGNVRSNDTIVGLFQFIKSTVPVAIYNLKTGFLSKVFPGPNSPVTLINKKTLKAEHLSIKSAYYDSWMTDEGLGKVINYFGEESSRQKHLEIEGRYVGLIYNDPKTRTIRAFQDIDDLPEGYDRSLVTPMTFCELIYMSVYHYTNHCAAFVTRYPITGMGSIYPSTVYLKPTVKGIERRLLNDNWEVDEAMPPAYNWPTLTEFVNSMSPSNLHLGMLGADFDGDTTSLNIVYSDEAVREVLKYLQSSRYYVGTNGRMNFSVGTDTVKFCLKNMTGA